MKHILTLLVALLLAPLAVLSAVLEAGEAINTTFDIRSFGAVGDGSTLNTAAIQKAIDACTASGGGEVVIAGGKFVTGTIYLKDNVTLHLAAGAALWGSTNIADYATDTHKNVYAGESHMDRCLIFARGARNIGITGRGTIDGRGQKAHFPNPGSQQRPMLIRFLECTNVRMRDVTLLNPAAWTSAWLYCEDIVVDGVSIRSRANANGDGLDFDGCRNVRVSNCSFDTSDDSICLQGSRADQVCRDVVIANCVFVSQWAGIRIGLASMGDFENVTVSNCVFRDIADAGLKIQMCEGGTMRNMVFANLAMQNVPRPVFLTFNRWRMGVDTPSETPPMKSMRDMQFQNIRVDNSRLAGVPCGIVLSGVPGHCIENIAFDNVSLTIPGGGTNQEALVRDLPTFADQRPEFHVLGKTIPFAGFYARHVRGLSLNSVRISAVRAEARPAVMCDDVHDLAVTGATVSDKFSGSESIYLRDVQKALIRDCRAGRGATLVRKDGPKNREVEVLPRRQQDP
jgi:polygalacturonase